MMYHLSQPINVYVVGGNTYYAKFIKNSIAVDSLEKAQIVLFTGGEDVDPVLYKAERHPSTYSNLSRDLYEKEIFEKVNKYTQICIGVCRGAQFLAVMNGNKLIQDVSNHALRGTHTIFNTADSSSMPHKFEITSTHHQMAYIPSEEYRDVVIYYEALARSDHYSGISTKRKIREPEIFVYNSRHINKPVCLCIQGHPEMMDSDSTAVITINNLIGDLLQKLGMGRKETLHFNILSDNSRWSSKCKTDENLTITNQNTWCYGELFKERFPFVSPKQKYEIEYTIDTPVEEDYKITRNMCFLSKEDIKIYFEKLRKFHDFKYSIQDFELEGYIKGYRFIITIDDNTFWHKMLITLIRYVYEFPYSFILYDALQFMKKGYHSYSIMNILNVISYTTRNIISTSDEYDFFAYSCYDRNYIISYFDKTHFTGKVSEYIDKLETDYIEGEDFFGGPQLNDFCVTLTFNTRSLSVISGSEFYQNATYYSWTSYFDKRFPYYVQNFEKFKKYKK